MDHNVCNKEFEHRVLKVEEWYGLESLLLLIESAPLERSSPAVQRFTSELSLSHHRFHAYGLYINGTAQIDTETGNNGA